MEKRKSLAIFDFDGTITKKDSFVGFIKFCVGGKFFLKGLIVLSPTMFLFKTGFISNQEAKERFITYFLRGWTVKSFEAMALDYSEKKLPNIIRDAMTQRMNWHRANYHYVVVISASLEAYLKYWCVSEDVDLIATCLEVENGYLTGKISSKNCFGVEKVNRLKEKYDLKAFQYIYAYGDSKGDREILNIADEKYYKGKRITKNI